MSQISTNLFIPSFFFQSFFLSAEFQALSRLVSISCSCGLPWTSDPASVSRVLALEVSTSCPRDYVVLGTELRNLSTLGKHYTA